MWEAILLMIPWSTIIYAVVEYFFGKTDWFEANSVGELIENIIKKLINKDQKI